MIPVKAPANAPAKKAIGNARNGSCPSAIRTAATTPPKVKLPSVVISGILNMRMEIKMPIASEANPSPSMIALR